MAEFGRVPDTFHEAYGLLWYLHEREFGTNSRAKEREQRRAEARKLEEYKRSVERIKRQQGME